MANRKNEDNTITEMQIEALSGSLGGNEYGCEIFSGQEIYAKKNGLVVVFGRSDNLIIFKGAIDCAIAFEEDKELQITSAGTIESVFQKMVMSKKRTIKANIHKTEKHKWMFWTKVCHNAFDIVLLDHVYSQGIVFSLNDFKG